MSLIASFVVPHPPLIVKEIGNGRERTVEKTIDSYIKVSEEIASLKPETIIISSPHTECYEDYFFVSTNPKMEGDFKNFGAPDVKFKEEIDLDLALEIEKISQKEKFKAGGIDKVIDLDHGTMVPLYYIRKKYNNFKLVVVGLSGFSLESHFEFGKIIDRSINNLGRKVVFVASGDLSHKLREEGPYGFAKEGPIYDDMIQKTLSNANFTELLKYDKNLLFKAAECGHPSFTIMAGALDDRKVKPNFYSHEDVTGVGYGLWSFYPNDEYVMLARDTIFSYIKYGKKIDIPSYVTKELRETKKGVFVTIHKKGLLRGCIGTFLPVYNCLAQEIIENAISSSTRDPRFPRISEEELNDLYINVDVLSTPETINSISQLDPKKYGVIVQSGLKKGLLLPNIEGIDSVSEQIFIAKQKANINPNEEVTLQRFEVIRHK